MTKFTDEIWNHRLQLIWIIFTIFYLMTGGFTTQRWVSSLMITLGAGLILANICQVLFNEDHGKTRPTFLIIFTACLFLAKESYKTYNDPVGTIFAALAATVSGLLAWFEEPRIYQSLKITFFTLLLMIFVTSLIQLLSTMAIKELITLNAWDKRLYIIAPHAAGIVVGITISLAFGKSLLPVYISGVKHLSLIRISVIFCLFYILAIIISYTFNDKRLIYISGNPGVNLAFVAVYTLPALAAPVYGCYRSFKKQMPLLGKSGVLYFLAGMPVIISLSGMIIIYLFTYSGGNEPQGFIDSFVIQYIPALSLGISILSGVYLITLISGYFYRLAANSNEERVFS